MEKAKQKTAKCEECGSNFLKENGRIYCSNECTRDASIKKVKEARKKILQKISPIGKVCFTCRKLCFERSMKKHCTDCRIAEAIKTGDKKVGTRNYNRIVFCKICKNNRVSDNRGRYCSSKCAAEGKAISTKKSKESKYSQNPRICRKCEGPVEYERRSLECGSCIKAHKKMIEMRRRRRNQRLEKQKLEAKERSNRWAKELERREENKELMKLEKELKLWKKKNRERRKQKDSTQN